MFSVDIVCWVRMMDIGAVTMKKKEKGFEFHGCWVD